MIDQDEPWATITGGMLFIRENHTTGDAYMRDIYFTISEAYMDRWHGTC